MFFRTKTSGPRTYLQVVENRWEGGRSRQRVVATLGRLDQLQQSGQLDALLVSGARLARSVLVLSEHAEGKLPTISVRHIGPALIFQRLWQRLLISKSSSTLLKARRFEFSVERAIFLTVLHRLFAPGSDRAAEKWKDDYAIEGAAVWTCTISTGPWPGWERFFRKASRTGPRLSLPAPTRTSSRKLLFARRRDLFSDLDIVFFDTTSIYFEGEGGETIGQRGHSQRSSSRPEADGGGHGAGPERQSGLQRTLAGQHGRREELVPDRGTVEEPVRNRHRCASLPTGG